jgi:tetratricopeptide (TPR) repeat protein
LAIAELEQALAYYRQVDDQFYIAWSLKVLGQAHIRLGKTRQAIGCFQQSLRIFQALGLSELPVLNVLGLALASQGEFEQGEACLHRAYRLSQTERNHSDMAGALVYLSRILSQKGDFDGAQTAVLEALAIADEHSLEYRQVQARMDVGLRAYERGDYEQAFAYLGQVQERLTTEGNQRRVEIRLGLTMYHRGQADLAWQYLANRLHQPAKLALYSLPLAAMLFHKAGLAERATGLLALFLSHNRSVPLHLENKVALELDSFKATLAAALTPEVFAAAWEQGRSLDLTTTLTDVAEELSQPIAPSPATPSQPI